MCWHMIRFYHTLSNDSLMLEAVEKEEEEEEEAEEVLSNHTLLQIFSLALPSRNDQRRRVAAATADPSRETSKRKV